jgi:hypothetical protein
MIKHFFSRFRTKPRGQSFVELMLVTLILALMLSGVVEFGYLLNSYLKVLDGSREGARFASNGGEAFQWDGSGYVSLQSFYLYAALQTMNVMAPIVLNGNRGDDILISVFTVSGGSITRWPDGYVNGWDVCDNRGETTLGLDAAKWNSCTHRNSHFSTLQVLGLMDPGAPGSGIVLVEIYYNYPQILKLPVFAQAIPDPIPVYTYSVMPLSSAEPTPTP